MRRPSKISMARIIVQADNAWDRPPDPSDKEVLKILNLSDKEVNEQYGSAVRRLSAMRWNTLTLRIK